MVKWHFLEEFLPFYDNFVVVCFDSFILRRRLSGDDEYDWPDQLANGPDRRETVACSSRNRIECTLWLAEIVSTAGRLADV